MTQPWWVYGLIALICALLILTSKIVEHKFMKKEDDLGLFSLVIGAVGALALLKAAGAIKLFSD